MKQLFLIAALVSIATGAKADVIINSTTFPDAAFRNYLLAQDYGKDGKISEDEIKTVTWINVEEMGIKSLKGIEIFSELTSLYCSDNQLTELDLSMNTKLSTLWCQRNQLTKLDVSNTAVKHVLQCYQNQLKGKNMDAFIAGLPINTDEVFPYYLFVYQESPNEGNVMTKAQVAAATARGWTVMMYWENGDMDLYEGITLMGDVNDDGAVDVADIATVIDVMAGKAPEYKDKADVNNDKTVDVADIATIIDIMAGKDVNTQPDENAYTTCPNKNHPHWIDLGLPSGTQWQCCNQGASKPENDGGYYTFDEAKAYNPPSLDQIKELHNNTTSEWTTQNGVDGRKFTSSNGGSLFLPAAGSVWEGELYGVGYSGNYWSSTPCDESSAYVLEFGSGYASCYEYLRSGGRSIRPVR